MCIYKHLASKKSLNYQDFENEEIIQQLILNKIFDFNRKVQVVYEEVLFNFDLQRLDIETGLKLF